MLKFTIFSQPCGKPHVGSSTIPPCKFYLFDILGSKTIEGYTLMKVSFFKWGYKKGWETNVHISKFSLRIARHQFAFWIKNDPLFNLLF